MTRKFYLIETFDGQLPKRQTAHSAAYDFYACEDVEILPWIPTRIKTGVKVELNKDESGKITLKEINKDSQKGKENYSVNISKIGVSTPVIINGEFSIRNPYFRISQPKENKPKRTFNKLKPLKDKQDNVTEKQKQEAREWYNSSPLKKWIPFEEMFHLVNSHNPDSIATWSQDGIILYKGSDYTELYHEAFHGFFQAFLTTSQKNELYKELSNQKGWFTDYNGKRVSFKKADKLQLQEYLAEDFRQYMLSGKFKKKTPIKMNIFERILRFLDYLFSGVSIEEQLLNDYGNTKINELYEKLRVGNLNEFTFSESNIDTPVLNSTINKYKDNDTKDSISYKDSMLIVKSIDAVMARAIDFKNSYSHIPEGELRDQINQAHSGITVGIEPDSGEVALLDNHRLRDKSIFIDTISSKEGVEFLYDYVKNVFEYKKELLEESLKELKEGTVSYNKTKRNIDLLSWTLENFGDTKNIYGNREVDDGGVISYHLMKSEFFELEDKERIFDEKLEDIENEDTDLINGREGDINREGNKVSVKERASKEIIYIIKSLFQRKAKGRAIVKDEMLGITGITGEEFINNELG